LKNLLSHRLRRWALVGLMLWSWGNAGMVFANDLVLGKPAPDLVLHALDGKNYQISALRGKVVIVAFWASWCPPCQLELPILSEFAAQHAAQGVQILGFSLDDPENLAQVRTIAAQLRFPVGLTGSAWAGGYGRIWRLPVSFVIDRAGHLVFNGWDNPQLGWSREQLNRTVLPLLETNQEDTQGK